MNYDVVIVGAGPIGITTACTIKAKNPEIAVCVIDKRPKPTRNHGLSIKSDSVDAIQRVLQERIVDPNAVANLGAIFQGWSNNFIRTVKIEEDLRQEAEKMKVTVLRGKEYEVTPAHFEGELDKIFQSARIIIGADGAHSVVRKAVMHDRLVDEETLRHLIELKYQTEGQAKPRSMFEASSAAVQHGRLDFESMSKTQRAELKPVTLHIFVNEPTFDAMRVEDTQGNLKGVPGNTWTLSELNSKKDHNVYSVYRQLMSHVENVKERGGGCYDEQISTLIMNIYRSEEAVKEHKGKIVMLVGDAESGIVLEGGFNKGLKGAAACAEHVINYLNTSNPAVLLSYQEKMVEIFNEAKNWAKFKNTALDVIGTSAASSHTTYESSSSNCVIS